MFVGILGTIGTRIEITNRIGTVIWFISGALNFVPPLILGKYIETFPMIFVIIQMVYMFISLVCIISIVILVKSYNNNNKTIDMRGEEGIDK